MLTKVSAFIFDNPTTFDAADSMLDTDAHFGHILIEPLLDFGQLSLVRFLKRLYDKNVFRHIPLESLILKEVDTIGESDLILLCHGFIVHFSLLSGTQIHDVLTRDCDKVVLYGVGFFFPL